jgi:hypothetical protein
MIPEPYARVQALSACRNPDCRAPHPLARNYWKTRFADYTKCPQCGCDVDPPGDEIDVPVVMSGLWGLAFSLCVGIGKGLLKLGRLITPKKE